MNITTPNTSPLDRAVREASARSAALLRSNCTLREQSLIAFAPLVLIDIAFTYAGKCRNYAAKKRVLNLKPVCRAFDACTTRWQETIASALDYEHRNHIHHEAQKFLRECSNDFARMWFTACNLWNIGHAHLPHQPLRVDALCGLLMLNATKRLSDMNNTMLRQRIGIRNDGCYETAETKQLRKILEAYSGVHVDTSQLAGCVNVIINRLMEGTYIEANL